MMKLRDTPVILLMVFLFTSCNGVKNECGTNDLERICDQMDLMFDNARNSKGKAGIDNTGDPILIPLTTTESGELRFSDASNWCSGFYPGMLWLMFDLTGDDKWESRAKEYTELLEEMKYNSSTHDLGFIMHCSYGNGYRITGNEAYRDVLVHSAGTLASRFNEKVGCIRSWDWNGRAWQFPVIIDNMMNLELLFWAAGETGDSSYYKMARSHAITTMNNQFREDFSTYHVVDYDTVSGNLISRQTFQGYSDESCWSRGEAWALYGYTLTYRYTGESQFLEQAEAVAGFILHHPALPEDLVPYWDYDAPGIPEEPRDASAAAITASALLELSTYLPDGTRYLEAANRIMETLRSPAYSSEPGTNAGFILDHSVGHIRDRSGVDKPVVYADYYYLEALSRLHQVEGGNRIASTGDRPGISN